MYSKNLPCAPAAFAATRGAKSVRVNRFQRKIAHDETNFIFVFSQTLFSKSDESPRRPNIENRKTSRPSRARSPAPCAGSSSTETFCANGVGSLIKNCALYLARSRLFSADCSSSRFFFGVFAHFVGHFAGDNLAWRDVASRRIR